jgi:hypothetical protein
VAKMISPMAKFKEALQTPGEDFIKKIRKPVD